MTQIEKFTARPEDAYVFDVYGYLIHPQTLKRILDEDGNPQTLQQIKDRLEAQRQG